MNPTVACARSIKSRTCCWRRVSCMFSRTLRRRVSRSKHRFASLASQRFFHSGLQRSVSGFSDEIRAAGMDVAADSPAVEEKGHAGPAAGLAIEPPAAERGPFFVDADGKLEAQPARLRLDVL